MSQHALKPAELDDLETAVDEAIRLSGGDARAAILGLIRGQHSLEDQIARTVSAGYVRRKPH